MMITRYRPIPTVELAVVLIIWVILLGEFLIVCYDFSHGFHSPLGDNTFLLGNLLCFSYRMSDPYRGLTGTLG